MKTFKKLGILFLCMLLLTTTLTACKKKANVDTPTGKGKTEVVKLFFPLKDNGKLGTESREVTYQADSDKLKAVMEELLKGPKDLNTLGLAANVGTKINGVTINGKQATIDFSSAFKSFGGVMEEQARIAAVVDTALQVSGLEEIKLTVDGQELIAPSGQPYGFMKFREYDTTAGIEKREVSLYFANANADGVVAEKRIMDVPKNATKEAFYTMLVNGLISGPTDSTLYKTIPPEATILRLQVDGEIVTVDFSKEMYTKHWKGTAGETMTLASIVNTLTEYPEVKRVMLLIEGQPMNIDSVVVNEPLTRMNDLIKQK